MSSNPFRFYVAAAPKNISFELFQAEESTDNNYTANSNIVKVGLDGVAFILDYNASVYNVHYTLIGGDITNFSANLSNETTTAIVKAPLEQSFGTFNLYDKASIAFLMSSTESILDQMQLTLSETTIAGASGAFTYGVNLAQRERYDRVLTQISKPALLFFIIVCFLYAALGLVLMVTAFALRARPGVPEKQAKLLSIIELSHFSLLDVVEDSNKVIKKTDSIRDNWGVEDGFDTISSG